MNIIKRIKYLNIISIKPNQGNLGSIKYSFRINIGNNAKKKYPALSLFFKFYTFYLVNCYPFPFLMTFVYSLDSLRSSMSIARKVDTIGKNAPAIHQIQKEWPFIHAIYAGMIPEIANNQKLLIKKSILLPKINSNRDFKSKKNNTIPPVFNNNNPQFLTVFIRIFNLHSFQAYIYFSIVLDYLIKK